MRMSSADALLPRHHLIAFLTEELEIEYECLECGGGKQATPCRVEISARDGALFLVQAHPSHHHGWDLVAFVPADNQAETIALYMQTSPNSAPPSADLLLDSRRPERRVDQHVLVSLIEWLRLSPRRFPIST